MSVVQNIAALFLFSEITHQKRFLEKFTDQKEPNEKKQEHQSIVVHTLTFIVQAQFTQ